MKMNSDNKKQMLLETFEILKDKFSANGSSLAILIGMMAKVYVNTAVEMWKYG